MEEKEKRHMILQIFLVFVAILIFVRISQYLSTSSQEGFYPYSYTYVYHLADTSKSPLTYQWCIGMPEQEFLEDEDRFRDCPFYMASYLNKPFQKIEEIEQFVAKETKELSQTITAVLISSRSPTHYDIFLLCPNLRKDKSKATTKQELAKNHRWYYTLLYTDMYSAGELCSNKSNYQQCPNIPITQKSRFEKQAVAVKKRPAVYFPYGYNPADWTIDYYITPCGVQKGQEHNPYVPIYPKTRFYAFYLPNPKTSLFQHVASSSPRPNVSMLSDGESMRYGCETQLVSQNERYVLLMENMGGSKGLRLYEVSGDPFVRCRENRTADKRRLVWNIPLSQDYARFKIVDNRIILVDYDVVIWSIEVNIPNSPVLLRLEDNGTLQIFDADDNVVQEFSADELAKVGDPSYLNSKFQLNRLALQKNYELDKEAKRKEQERLRIADAEKKRQEDLERQKRFENEQERACSREV